MVSGVDQLRDLGLVASLDGLGDVPTEDLQVGGHGDLRRGEQVVLQFVSPHAELAGLAAGLSPTLTCVAGIRGVRSISVRSKGSRSTLSLPRFPGHLI